MKTLLLTLSRLMLLSPISPAAAANITPTDACFAARAVAPAHTVDGVTHRVFTCEVVGESRVLDAPSDTAYWLPVARQVTPAHGRWTDTPLLNERPAAQVVRFTGCRLWLNATIAGYGRAYLVYTYQADGWSVPHLARQIFLPLIQE